MTAGSEGRKRLLVGWREWVALPELGLPALKAKIDTGARTSSLHAYYIKPFQQRGKRFVRFGLHPAQRRKSIARECIAEVIDRRHVTDSGGRREFRYVIRTLLRLGGQEWPIEITLANRETMMFRMLLGRTALEGRAAIDPARSFVNGRITPAQLRQLYAAQGES